MNIKNPSSSQPITAPDHTSHPLHETLVKAGFAYSHTTPIGAIDGQSFNDWHSYRRGERAISVPHYSEIHPGNLAFRAKSSCGSGRETIGKGLDRLATYLKNIARR